MALSLKPQHVQRYRDIARLFLKYGRGDLLQNSGLDEPEPSLETPAPVRGNGSSVPLVNGVGPESPHEQLEPSTDPGKQFAEDLEKLGPTFVKIGQFLSTRGDLLPANYIEALSRLQDSVEPVPFADIECIVVEELGTRISKAFASFEETPIATASLGQVHRAQLREGQLVAVKVQRPDIHERIREDLEAMSQIAGFIDQHTDLGRHQAFEQMVEEFRKTLLRELDYRQEAANLTQLADNMAGFERILVPRPIRDYVTARVLTMDFVHGRKVTSMGPLARMEMDGEPLAEELTRAYLQQILVDGFFHADPHPGNVLLTDDCRLALIDLGMVAQIGPLMQEDLLKLVLAVSEGRGDDAGDLLVRIGQPLADSDPRSLRRRVGELVLQFHGLKLRDIALGRFLFECARASSESGYRMPREFTILSKTLLNVDEVSRHLDPEFDPNASIRRNAASILRERMLGSLSPGKLFAGLLEAKEFAEHLPRRLNQLIDSVAENRIRFKVDAINEVLLMEGLQKIANRITLGVVIAAMIVGAALLMRIETTFRILGYPGLAIIFFLIAALAAFGMAFNILFNDLKASKAKVKAVQHRKEDFAEGN